MDTITIEFANAPRGPVAVMPEEFPHFLKGEVPPVIADKFIRYGMPRRGLVTFRMTVTQRGERRLIGPSLCRRAGTASSAVPRKSA
jgi:hypothetical protein